MTLNQPSFPRDSSILNRNNKVRICLALPRDWFHLELMLENCAGDIVGMQENNRRSEQARQSLLTTLFTSYPDPFGTVPPVSTSTVQAGTEFESKPTWNRLAAPNRNVPSCPLETRGLSVPGMSQFQLEPIPWKCCLKEQLSIAKP